MNILDGLVIVFVAWCVYKGWKKGLISQVLGLAGVIIAIIAAANLGQSFGSWLAGFINLEKFATGVAVTEAESKGVSGYIVDAARGAVPDMVTALQNILGYALVFLLVLGTVKLLALALESFNNVPVLGTFNSVGGLLLGFVKGAAIVLVGIWILNMLPLPKAMNLMESSLLAPALLGIAPGIYERIFNPQQYEGAWEALNNMREALKTK